jgi:hypothetical protein
MPPDVPVPLLPLPPGPAPPPPPPPLPPDTFAPFPPLNFKSPTLPPAEPPKPPSEPVALEPASAITEPLTDVLSFGMRPLPTCTIMMDIVVNGRIFSV